MVQDIEDMKRLILQDLNLDIEQTPMIQGQIIEREKLVILLLKNSKMY